MRTASTILVAASAAFAGAGALGCSGGEPDSRPPAGAFDRLPWPELTRLEPSVREQFEVARRALGPVPADAAANGHVAMLCEAYGFALEAEAWYRRAGALAPDEHRWAHSLGRVLAAAGRTDEAFAALAGAERIDSRRLETFLLAGELAIDAGRIDDALRSFGLARTLAPDSPHALAGLAEVALVRGELVTSRELFEHALRASPGFRRACHGLARVARARGDLDAARRALAGADDAPLALPDPSSDEVHALRRDTDLAVKRAGALFRDGDVAAALAVYERIAATNADFPTAIYNAARCLQTLDRHAEAIPRFEAFLARRPGNPDALGGLGASLLALGRAGDASARFEAALAVSPDHVSSRVNLALARLRRGDRRAALEELVMALRADPAHERAHLEILRLTGIETAPSASDWRRHAASLERERVFAAALWALERAVAVGGADAWRERVALAWLLAVSADPALRDPRRALAIVEPITTNVAANDAVALDTLAVALAACGRVDEAVPAAERALGIAQSGSDAASTHLVSRIAARLELYRRGEAFREP